MRKSLFFLVILLVAGFSMKQVAAEPLTNQKIRKKSAERQHAYEVAVTALKSKIFLLSFYSFVDKTGNLVELEPEGNFILVNVDKFIMQKSISLISNTFSGSGNFRGELANFQMKENRKGNIQFSFMISNEKRNITFKGKLNKGDNVIEGSIKGKAEDNEIVITGTLQPVQSHFVY